MTLSSTIRLNTPVDVYDLLDNLTRAVGGDPATALRTDTRVQPNPYVDTDHVRIGNQLGQGFSAIVDITFKPEGQLDLNYYDHADPDYPDEEFTAAPPGVIQVSLDTSYGGRSEMRGFDGEIVGDPDRGLNCSQLHLWLAKLIEWTYGVEVQFQNEYNGTWGTVDEQIPSMLREAEGAQAFTSLAIRLIQEEMRT